MQYQRTNSVGKLAPCFANSPINNVTTVLTRCLPALVFLIAILIAPSIEAQSFIRFNPTQERVTVPVNSVDSTTITNLVNLSGGATNANFDVSGLPAGAGYVLTDTNGNPLTSTTMDTNLWLTVNTTNIAEGMYLFRLNAGGMDTNGLPVTNSFPFVLQAAHLWIGSLNTTGLWSSASSWSNGIPTATSDVVFTDTGAQTNGFADTTGSTFTNSYVDANVTIASLRFSQTGITNFTTIATNPPPTIHHIQILPGKTLTISGTNGFSLMRDYFEESGSTIASMNVTIDGPGGKMVVSNQNANVAILVGAGFTPTLSLSNLDTFIAKVNRIGIGDYQLYPNYRDLNTALNVGHDTNSYSGRPRQLSANILWAKTNIFSATYVDPSNYTNEFTRGYGFSVNNNEQSGVGSSQSQVFYLGTSNLFFVDGVCFYGGSGSSSSPTGVRFATTNGSAIFRNVNGGTSRMSVFTISDDGGTNEAASNVKGTVDFSAGAVDILADRMYLARDRELIATNQTPNVQADLTIGKGTVDVNTVVLGFQEHTKPDWTVIGGGQPYLNYCQGRLIVTNGGIFKVNGTLTLGYTADTNSTTDAQQYNTFGRITIYSNSIVAVSNLVVDGGLNFFDSNNRQNQIIINTSGTMIISNSIGAGNFTGSSYPTFANQGLPGLPLDTLTMAPGGILTLFVTPGKTNVYVRNFTSTGIAPGIIKIASLPTFPVYPTNISLIAYTTATPVLAADMSAIAGNVQGYILNNSANHTIDLFLTTNAPRTLVWTGGTDNNWDLSTTNWAPLAGGAATAYSMGDIAIFNDSSSVTNINIVDVVVPNQATNGVIITNSTHIYTFNPAGGSIAGTAKIVKQGTNVLIFNAAESGQMAVTAGEVDVTGILGSTTLSSNTVLTVLSGGTVSGVTASNSTVTVQGGGAINGPVNLIGGWLENDGTISVGTGAFNVTNNAVVTNNLTITLGTSTGGGTGGYQVYAGSSIANFGAITVSGGRLFVDGTFFGTGQFFDNVNSSSSSAFGRLQLDSVPTALLSPGTNPTNSIGNFLAGVRLDMHASGPNNSVGKFLVEVDTINNVYDTITAARWNNIGCIWAMTNVNGTFQSGQSFRILVNANGVNTPNLVDTAIIFPLMQPTVPGPGLQWNLTGIQQFGTVGVTNSTMVWNGGGTGSWDTNGSAGSWKSTVYSDNQGAIFDDSASGSTTVTLNTAVAPAGFNIVSVTNVVTGVSTNVVTTTNTPAFAPGIVVSNALKDYTFVASAQTNRITGMTSIYKTGPGTLTVLASNDFTGGLVVDGGTLAMTNTSALGLSTGQNQIYNELLIDNNATIKFLGTNAQIFGKFITINQGGGIFEVSSNTAILTLNQNILGSGALTKTGPGMLVLAQTGDAYPGGTIVNAGTLRLTAAAAGLGTLTLNNNTTLELTNAFTFTNAVNLAGTSTPISLQGVSTNVVQGPWTGGGLVTITGTNATRMLVFNNDLTAYTGTISFGNSIGLFRFNNRTNDSPSLGSASATFDLGTGSATLFNVTRTNMTYDLGALSGGPNTTLSGSATNGGSSATTYSIGAKGVDSTFAGTISNFNDTVSIVKVGSGKLFLNGNSTYTGPTTVSNGTLGGSGSIASPLTVSAGGTLSPGATIGTFTVSNTAALGGKVLMELNQANTPAINDKLVVTGAITATGALVVTNVGPDIINGTKFTLFNKAVTGFTAVTLPSSNPANTSTYTWTTNLNVDGSITLLTGGQSSPVNPNPTNILFSVSGNTLTLSWPPDYLGWQLLSNSVGITATNQWFPVTGSTSTTQENLTFDFSKTNVFFRMIYPPLP